MEKYYINYIDLLKKLKKELPKQRDEINRMITEQFGKYVVHPVDNLKNLCDLIQSSLGKNQVLSSSDKNYYHHLLEIDTSDLLKKFIQTQLVDNEDDYGNPREERLLLFNRTNEVNFILVLPTEELFNSLINFVNLYPSID